MSGLILPQRGRIEGFLPSDISSAIYWWDTETNITTSGSTLTGWTDRIGSQAFTVNGSPQYNATSSTGGKTVIDFDGQTSQTDRLVSPTLDFDTTEIVHLFIVAGDMDATVSSVERLVDIDNGYGFQAQSTTGPFNGRLNYIDLSTILNGSNLSNGPYAGTGAWALFEILIDWNGGTGGTFDVLVDGVSDVSVANYDEIQMADATLSVCGNAIGSSGQYLKSSVGDILICNAEVTGDDLTNVRAYFDGAFVTA